MRREPEPDPVGMPDALAKIESGGPLGRGEREQVGRAKRSEPDPTAMSREELRTYLGEVAIVSLWPFAGKALSLSRSSTYSCPDIKCLKLGHLRKVSAAWLEATIFGAE